MKRILAFLCICALILSCAGCASGGVGKGAAETTEAPTTAETEVATEPPVTEPPATEPPTTEPPVTEPVKKEMSVPDLAEYVQQCTVTIIAENEEIESSGSGFFIDDEGTVVTSYHVIDAADSIIAKDQNGAKYDVVKIIDFSEMHDIAVLKLNISGNPYLELASEAARTGESVYAVGSPLGLSATFSDGIVSNSARIVGVIECIQTTASISPGNSGGPLVNAYGEVVGINAFSYRSGDDLNLAVKISELDLLEMDKNWSINQYREWYKKEIKRSYRVYNYTEQEFEVSKINTYQHVTGRDCYASSWDWSLDRMVEGYDDEYGVYIYEYDVQEFDKYTEYLNNCGFVFDRSEDFDDGVSYYYVNEFTGFYMDVFVTYDESLVMIEPYCY